MAKGIREKIKLVSSAGTGHFYTTTKNKRTKPEKLELKKFDPVSRENQAGFFCWYRSLLHHHEEQTY